MPNVSLVSSSRYKKELDKILSSHRISVLSESEDQFSALNVILDLETLPDVLLVDLNSRRYDPIKTQLYFNDRFPTIKTIFHCESFDDFNVASLIQAGADGILNSNKELESIPLAIHTILNGNSFFSTACVQHLSKDNLSKNEVSGPNPRISFSSIELEVIQLISQEHTNVEIALRINRTVRAVEEIKRRIIKRLNVRNSVGIVKYAIKNQILNINDS